MDTKLLSRAQLGKLAKVDDHALGFWLRSGVLENSVSGERKHGRYTVDEARIAAVLGELHSYGVNIAALREVAAVLRKALKAYRREGDKRWVELGDDPAQLDYWKVVTVGVALADGGDLLLIFRDGENWAADMVGGVSSLPSSSGLIVDLKHLLSGFKEL